MLNINWVPKSQLKSVEQSRYLEYTNGRNGRNTPLYAKFVHGKVKLELYNLYNGNITILGRSSDNSLYDHDIASMDKLGEYDQTDAKGFIKLNALRLKKQKPLGFVSNSELNI